MIKYISFIFQARIEKQKSKKKFWGLLELCSSEERMNEISRKPKLSVLNVRRGLSFGRDCNLISFSQANPLSTGLTLPVVSESRQRQVTCNFFVESDKSEWDTFTS